MKKLFSLTALFAMFAYFKAVGLMAQTDHENRGDDHANWISSDDGNPKAGAGENIVDGPEVGNVSFNSAVVTWITNIRGNSVIRYGTDPNKLDRTSEGPYYSDEKTDRQSHRVELFNLEPNTTYYFVVDSGQGSDSGTAALSCIETFTTRDHNE